MRDEQFRQLLSQVDPELLHAFGLACYARGAFDAGADAEAAAAGPALDAFLTTIAMADGARRAIHQLEVWGPPEGPPSDAETWG